MLFSNGKCESKKQDSELVYLVCKSHFTTSAYITDKDRFKMINLDDNLYKPQNIEKK